MTSIGESQELGMESGGNKELGIEVVTVLVYTDSSLGALANSSAWQRNRRAKVWCQLSSITSSKNFGFGGMDGM
jgi:hypothetical protein